MMENVALERNKMIVRTYYGSGERERHDRIFRVGRRRFHGNGSPLWVAYFEPEELLSQIRATT